MPASPWWGSFYERLVRLVKLTLQTTLGKIIFEIWRTEILNINCRPLVHTSSHNVQETLTLSHMICGRNLTDYKLKNTHNRFTPESNDNLKMVRKLQDKVNCYWLRFAKRYLNKMRQYHIYRRKKQSWSTCELEMGDIVLT